MQAVSPLFTACCWKSTAHTLREHLQTSWSQKGRSQHQAGGAVTELKLMRRPLWHHKGPLEKGEGGNGRICWLTFTTRPFWVEFQRYQIFKFSKNLAVFWIPGSWIHRWILIVGITEKKPPCDLNICSPSVNFSRLGVIRTSDGSAATGGGCQKWGDMYRRREKKKKEVFLLMCLTDVHCSSLGLSAKRGHFYITGASRSRWLI